MMVNYFLSFKNKQSTTTNHSKMVLQEEFEDTKGVIRIRKSPDNTIANRQKAQKDKQRH